MWSRPKYSHKLTTSCAKLYRNSLNFPNPMERGTKPLRTVFYRLQSCVNVGARQELDLFPG